jgi:hypothetical protein
MEWSLIIIGLFIVLGTILILGTQGGRPIQPGAWGGPDDTPMLPDKLLLARYDKKMGGKFYKESQKADISSIEDALKIYQKLRKDYSSAVIELNIAKLALDNLQRKGQKPDPSTEQFISNAMARARILINQDPDRYPMNIDTFVQIIETQWNSL